MASESIAPPPGSGGGLKYGIIGVGLIAAAAVLYFGMKGCGPDEPIAAPTEAQLDAGPQIERSTALAEEELVLPELEPDAGPLPDAGRRVRYVTRYVGGGGGGGNWNCSGEIPASAARSALASHNLQFRNCYERQLKKNNQLQGRVTVSMRVGRRGEVTAVQAGGSLRDSAVLSCVRQTAQRIRFPAPAGGACAVVAAPFNFTPRN